MHLIRLFAVAAVLALDATFSGSKIFVFVMIHKEFNWRTVESHYSIVLYTLYIVTPLTSLYPARNQRHDERKWQRSSIWLDLRAGGTWVHGKG